MIGQAECRNEQRGSLMRKKLTPLTVTRLLWHKHPESPLIKHSRSEACGRERGRHTQLGSIRILAIMYPLVKGGNISLFTLHKENLK
jgi:hypothetical protein